MFYLSFLLGYLCTKGILNFDYRIQNSKMNYNIEMKLRNLKSLIYFYYPIQGKDYTDSNENNQNKQQDIYIQKEDVKETETQPFNQEVPVQD